MDADKIIYWISKRVQSGYSVALVALITSSILYSLLYLVIPFESFRSGLLLTIVITLSISYPLGKLTLLYGKKLRKKSREARANNQIKSKLISILSHDIKSPLKNIKQMIKMVSDGSISDEEFKSLSNSLSNDIDKTLGLTRNLVNWIRIQQEGFKGDLKTCNLNNLVTETIALYQPIAENKEIRLLYKVSSKCDLISDPEMIKILLRNAISNAIKFTHRKGKVEIEHGVSNHNVIIKIHDTGIGLSKEKISDLMDLNELISEKGTEDEVGTGLGLHLCKNIIEHLNGKMKIESSKDGTTFIFSIPGNLQQDHKSKKPSN